MKKVNKSTLIFLRVEVNVKYIKLKLESYKKGWPKTKNCTILDIINILELLFPRELLGHMILKNLENLKKPQN